MMDGSIEGIVATWKQQLAQLEAAAGPSDDIATLRVLLDGVVAAEIDLGLWLYPQPRTDDAPAEVEPITERQLARLQARRRRILHKMGSAEAELEVQRARFVRMVGTDPASSPHGTGLLSIINAVAEQLTQYRTFIEQEQRTSAAEDERNA